VQHHVWWLEKITRVKSFFLVLAGNAFPGILALNLLSNAVTHPSRGAEIRAARARAHVSHYFLG